MDGIFPSVLGPRRSSAFEAIGRTAFNGPAQVRRVMNGQLPSTYEAQRPQLVPDPRTMSGPDMMYNRQQDEFLSGQLQPTGIPQSDPSSSNSRIELNVRIIIDPRTARGTISFSSDEYLCLSVGSSDSPKTVTTTADLANRVVGFTDMNRDWREAFDERKRLIHNNLESVMNVRVRTNHAAARYVNNARVHNDTSNDAHPAWVTRVRDFTAKYNCLGPYVSTGSAENATPNGGFRSSSSTASDTIVVTAKFVGEQLNMANVFGQMTRHANVGFCVGARQHLNPRIQPEDQNEQPVQWTPWMSARYRRPFLESNPYDMIRATAHPGRNQKQRIFNVMTLGAVYDGEQKSVISFMSDLSRVNDDKLLHMRGTEYMNSDLAYLALDVRRDPVTGVAEFYWHYETAYFVNLGDSKLTRGEGADMPQNLIDLLDNPSAYAERSHKSTVSVRMVK